MSVDSFRKHVVMKTNVVDLDLPSRLIANRLQHNFEKFGKRVPYRTLNDCLEAVQLTYFEVLEEGERMALGQAIKGNFDVASDILSKGNDISSCLFDVVGFVLDDDTGETFSSYAKNDASVIFGKALYVDKTQATIESSAKLLGSYFSAKPSDNIFKAYTLIKNGREEGFLTASESASDDVIDQLVASYNVSSRISPRDAVINLAKGGYFDVLSHENVASKKPWEYLKSDDIEAVFDYHSHNMNNIEKVSSLSGVDIPHKTLVNYVKNAEDAFRNGFL